MEPIEDNEGFIEILHEEKQSKWKKVFMTLIAIFLILLVTSYVWMSYGLADIIASFVESETLEYDKIKINDTSFLIFKGESYQVLLENYLKNQGQEFKACLVGEIERGDYEINEVIIPEMIEQSFTRVVSKSCPAGTIVELHSQPYRRCIESRQDLKTKELIKKTNPERLYVIMCEKERFNFY